ncbi:iron transporter [Sphaerisporangium melleum]|uniref:Iron transporter n=1 Tax=Sphaerisporangium melleum TaxID=321316 RepID=A0A917RHN7_9ACTN|nr:IucA/IucC family protein [Sphaerisporangium melleum]GGL08901.1 iron transporter [Sphaerisporangium melleum]GII68771.1 iron transporter [Sphaerisporangium melleum]
MSGVVCGFPTLGSPAPVRVEEPEQAARTGEEWHAVAERATLAALLRCCVREVAGPRGEVWAAPPYVLLRLAGTLIRVPASGGLALRFDGPAQWLRRGAWLPLSVDHLVRLVEAELGGPPAVTPPRAPQDDEPGTRDERDGRPHPRRDAGAGYNEEFAGQVAASRAAISVMLRERAAATPPEDPWLASEQALVLGHPFHPSPKARGGSGWARYAPETHAAFPLRLLGVRDDVLASGGDPGAVDGLGAAPPGYTLLPAHPWQLELLAAELAAPLEDGRLVDLGSAPRPAVPTSSVRTVYEPAIGACLKFSLDVRITNCVRKNAWYELISATELSGRLEPVFADLSRRFPGTRWLPEPGYRSASLGRRLLEGLGVIVRSSPWDVTGPGVVPVLAGALAALGATPHPASAPVPRPLAAADTAMREEPARWWGAYVDLVALPALDAFFRHGVVLEAHLQNVLVGIDAEGMPLEVIFRDLEGSKLVHGRHDLTGLPDPVTRAATYDPIRGWNRVVYCVMVNHLPEIAATVARAAAPHAPDELLRELWAGAGARVARYAGPRRPAPLADLLAGAPLPAKANLATRWARAADRDAGYVPVANPFAGGAR